MHFPALLEQPMRALVFAAAAVLTAGCSSLSGSAGRPATPTPSQDQATVWACQYAKTSTETTGKPALKAARSARGQAALSDVPTLREIAAKNSKARLFSPADDGFATAAALSIRTWCMSHGLNG